MPTLDTNCLVRWLIRDDPGKTAMVDALLASHKHLRVPDAAIIETIYVLESFYGLDREHVTEAVTLLMGQSAFDLDRSFWSQVMASYKAHPKLSCTDIYLSLDATRHNAGPLISFDKKVINQLGAVSP